MPWEHGRMRITSAFFAIGIGFLAVGCQNERKGSAASDPGRELVMESIAAHGGKEKWYGNGQLQFRWIYHMEDRGRRQW